MNGGANPADPAEAGSPANLDDIFLDLIRARRAQALARRHRLTLWLSGDADWTAAGARRLTATLPENLEAVWLTERPLVARTRPLRAATSLLGQDLDLLVYDAHGGLDPDGFGAATGAIRGGGLLVLLTPDAARWPYRPDPQAERIAVWPYDPEHLSGHFLERLARVLAEDPHVLHIRQRATAPSLSDRPSPGDDRSARSRAPVDAPADPARPGTPNQHEAFAAILKTARGRARRPLVLIAHRGRGKSAALGLAAGHWLLEGQRRILITAPRRASVEAIHRHAMAVLAANGTSEEAVKKGRRLEFHAPEALARDPIEADLLLVDEAAGIPAPLLEAFLEHYPRIVFATTVHGYEGTGRGFEVRFRATLERLTPNWRALTLDTPIRWAADDPLEALTFRALLLDAAPAPSDAIQTAHPGNCAIERPSQAALLQDETTLRELFGLLVLAHYQTRPMDLRMLLDGPNVRILVLRHAGHVVATLLAAEEGGFEEAGLREAIYRGQRRPRGHLLPQTLSAHAGLIEAPAFHYLRVIRIAVHPAVVGRGLGGQLLTGLLRVAEADGLDLVGASFGATPELLGFWHRQGFVPVQIGASRNAASGEHAAVVLQPVSTQGEDFIRQASRRLESRLPVLLAGPLRALDPLVAVALLRARPSINGVDEESDPFDQRRELAAFVTGHRTLEATLPLLSELTRRRLVQAVRSGALDLADAGLLAAAARQLRPMPELVQLFRASGRDEMLERLRRAAGCLIDGLDSPRDETISGRAPAIDPLIHGQD
ncbi:tRNA(Met) cytidine acetyltransferase TmcA [Thiocystis violacea]|uniref:tRNA(Met) cytidine acetyltransferase TmcA n=1 Tax=Thiocystis violacea TaxID=13725 RepID=UPI0019072DF1|nr:GNAT family N-acetyltransferase [Thiocystis violacea]MBK1720459.1 GNAT family N-acetyltransferase [Thiocystis violacea]